MPSKHSGSTSGSDIVAIYTTPLAGLQVSLDRATLEKKILKHGVAWVSLEQCQVVFEEPEAVYYSQRAAEEAWAKGMLLFYCRPFVTTPRIKYVRGVADFAHGEIGRVVSVYTTQGIGNVGPQVYPVATTENSDSDDK